MKRLVRIVALSSAVWTLGLSAERRQVGVETLLVSARHALGGDHARSAPTSFKVKGLIKSGNRGESGTFEMTYELPGKFVQIENRTFLDPGETVSGQGGSRPSINNITVKVGFNGNDGVYERSPRKPAPYWPPTREELDRAASMAKVSLVNLTLGIFASSVAGAPVQFREAAGADAGRAVRVEGTAVSGTLVFNSQTHLPERFGKIRYEGYRDLNGRKVPSRIVIGGDEWIITEFTLAAR